MLAVAGSNSNSTRFFIPLLNTFFKGSSLAARFGRENNLNAVRLFLSLLVVFAHCFPLALGLERTRHFTVACGEGAVNLFFFISGLLITMSWLRSKSMNDYLRKRIFRIYPGFIVALLFSTIVMTAANPILAKSVFSWTGIKTTLKGCVFLSSISLTGDAVFPRNPFPGAVNSSLWTIPIEFQCYLLICIIGLFCLFRYRWWLLALFIYAYLLLGKGLWLGWDISAMDRRFLTYFSAGMCVCLWRDKIPCHWSIALVCVGLIIGSVFATFTFQFIAPFVLTYLTLWAGYAKPLKLTQWCNTTDLSYGVYLYAFPIQQLIATSTYGRNPWRMLLAAVPLTLLAALASWHVVEKPFLRLKAARFVERDPAVNPPVVVTKTDAQLAQAF